MKFSGSEGRTTKNTKYFHKEAKTGMTNKIFVNLVINFATSVVDIYIVENYWHGISENRKNNFTFEIQIEKQS